jgi:hypothetical protein
VNLDNSLVLQKWVIPQSVCSKPDASIIITQSSGHGTALVRFIKTYNVPKVESEKSVFNISLCPKRINNELYSIKTCVKFLGTSVDEISLFEFELFSGFKFSTNVNELKKTYSKIRNVKVIQDKVTFVLCNLDENQYCFNWEMVREKFVCELKPTFARIYRIGDEVNAQFLKIDPGFIKHYWYDY